MNLGQNLKICFIGAKQTGVVGFLTALAAGNEVLAAVSYSSELKQILNSFFVPVYESVTSEGFFEKLRQSDLLLSVHGREIVSLDLLRMPRFGGINVHPYLYRYKGADPVGRALSEKNFKASVGIHVMGQTVDVGEVVVEEFTDVSGANSVEEVYNRLYSYYSRAVFKALDIISREWKGGKR